MDPRQRQAAASRPERWTRWGIAAGIFFCILALFSLSLGVVPLVRAALNKPAPLELPGQNSLNLRLPGNYVAVAQAAGLSPADSRKVSDLQVFFSDINEKNYLPLVKFPPRSYAEEKSDAQLPLFQVTVPEPGKYLLSADYPIGVEGAKVRGLLFHIDVSYVRTELIVGVLVALLFGGLGGVLIWKNLRPGRPPKINPTP